MIERTALDLPRAIAVELHAHARSELPNEACGLLAGDLATGVVATFHPAANRHASPLRYDVDPEDLVRITFAIEAAGQELVAIFHSHPTSPAIPSATDVREARYDVIQLIASLADLADRDAPPGGVLRAWRISAAGPIAVELRIA